MSHLMTKIDDSDLKKIKKIFGRKNIQYWITSYVQNQDGLWTTIRFHEAN